MKRRDTTGLSRYEPSVEITGNMVPRGSGDYVMFEDVENMITQLDDHITKLHAEIDRLRREKDADAIGQRNARVMDQDRAAADAAAETAAWSGVRSVKLTIEF